MHPLARRARAGTVFPTPVRVLSWFLLAGMMSALAISGCGQEDPPLEPAPTEGSIGVLATSAGATIFLDGDSTGLVTPDTLNAVAAGTHEITVSLSGFAPTPDTASVTVTAGETANVFFTMTALVPTGSIAVLSDLPGGAIHLDGNPTGQIAPDTLITIPEGDHTVSIVHTGAIITPESTTISVVGDSLVTATFDEEPIIAEHRTVLLEHFTNYFCAPCTHSEPKLDSLYHSVPRDTVIYIAYHENIASSTDPFYLANPGENLARLNYYGVTGSPWVGLDGGMLSLGVFGWDSEQAYPILHDSTVVRATPSPPLTITVEAEPVGSDYHLRAGIYASAPPGPGTYKLHVVVVEKEPTGPPGIEGQTIYPWAMRDMIPTSSGTTFTITNGDLVNYEFEVPLNPAWDLDELGVVVFVQRNDKAVIQSGSTFE